MRWKVISSRPLFQTGFFRLRQDKCELPDGRVNPHYFVMEFLDWVNVVPVTKDGDMILVRQYRHAAGEVLLEIPGGSTDSRGEDPMAAGQRELREETGYTSDRWSHAGFHYPNPALQNNRMHTFLALDCVLSGPQELDPFEDLELVRIQASEVYARLDRGEIVHSLIVASLALVRPTLRKHHIIA